MSLRFYCIINISDICTIYEHSGIAYLSAAFCVKWCYVENYNNIIALNSCFDLGAVLINSKYLCVSGFKVCIACEYCRRSVNLYAVVCPGRASLGCMIRLGSCPLFFCELCEAVTVNSESFFLTYLFCKIYREAVCIRQLESVIT